MDANDLRELIDSRVRPGQPGASVVVHRSPAPRALAPTGHLGTNRWDWATQSNWAYGVYGRGRYGVARYRAIARVY